MIISKLSEDITHLLKIDLAVTRNQYAVNNEGSLYQWRVRLQLMAQSTAICNEHNRRETTSIMKKDRNRLTKLAQNHWS